MFCDLVYHDFSTTRSRILHSPNCRSMDHSLLVRGGWYALGNGNSRISSHSSSFTQHIRSYPSFWRLDMPGYLLPRTLAFHSSSGTSSWSCITGSRTPQTPRFLDVGYHVFSRCTSLDAPSTAKDHARKTGRRRSCYSIAPPRKSQQLRRLPNCRRSLERVAFICLHPRRGRKR